MRYQITKSYLETFQINTGLNNFYQPKLSHLGFPLIKSESYIIPQKLYKYSSRKKTINPDLLNSTCHFFIDDYRFTHLWNSPQKEIKFLRQFEYLLLPDFTIASELSPIQNQWQHYRKMWIGAYWEAHGLKVIPTVNWTEKSYDWCFEGMPKGTTIAIATMEINQKDEWQSFNDGLKAMIRQLEPSNLLIYGKLHNSKGQIEIPYSIPYTRYFSNYMSSFSYPFFPSKLSRY
jgi:Domain of unknown function (DUF4417)